MNPRLISLAAGVTPELETDPERFVRTAAAAGWPACGVWFDAESWTDATTAAVRRAFDDTGMVPVDMEVIRMGTDLDQGERLVDAAAEIGARNILTISAFADPGAAAERLVQLQERAAPGGIRVCLEFMRFTAVRTLADAIAVVDATGSDRIGILVDLLHLHRSGGSVDDVRAADPALFPYAQWCDAPAEPRGWDTREIIVDALDDRCAPGEGGLDALGFPALFAPEVPMSMEVRSRALRDGFPDPTDRAAHLLELTRAAAEDGAAE